MSRARLGVKKAIDSHEVRCGICGHIDSGNYCSVCGNPLVEDAAGSLEILWQLIKNLIVRDWVKYFRTLHYVVLKPSWFFSNYFNNPYFVHSYGISTYPNFLVHHLIFTNLLAAFLHILYIRDLFPLELLDAMGLRAYEPFLMIEDLVFNILDFTLFLAASMMIHIWWGVGLRRKKESRRLSLGRTIIGSIYCQGLLVFVVPYRIISLYIVQDNVEEYGLLDSPWTMLSAGIGLCFLLTYVLHTIPVCFNAAHGVGLKETRVVSLFYSGLLSLFVTQVLRLVISMGAV